MVSYEGPVGLVNVTGVIPRMEEYRHVKTLDSKKYQALLTEYLVPSLEKDNNRLEKTFQKDGTSIHTSKKMQAFFQQEGITPPVWPAKGPDFSVIENVWGLIKNKLKHHNIQKLFDIEAIVMKLWNEIVTPEYCRALYDGLLERIQKKFANGDARINH
ncbi:hypothetical protein BV898_15209 [Hypsibius exemplaris]|uniref:Tc1-like transposase DDE domain-containing protein n=1 Tax=Hypsibius exemplaris TaxID=2072580 RepID=A0A9X6NA68_HYPEX|nr:hypothetical protein BV898_15209 [Hypsibius exemplaris]